MIIVRKAPKNNLGLSSGSASQPIQGFSTPVNNTVKDSYFEMNPWFITGFTDGEGCF